MNNNKKKKDKIPKSGVRHVLKGVSGFAIPGETVFIMGSSGTGKTSLLNILSLRERTR